MIRLNCTFGFVLAALWTAGCGQSQYVSMGAEAGTPGIGGNNSDAQGGASNGGDVGGATSDATVAGGAASVGGDTSNSGGSSSNLVKPVGPWANVAAPVDKASQIQVLSAMSSMTPQDLTARSTTPLGQPLGYAPETAKWLELIQASSLALNEKELAAYQANGFVISERQSYPNFFYAYKTIYAADLPIYVSADSILYALHRSYDKILMQVESSYLSSTLQALIATLRGAIATSTVGDNAKHDIGLLLGVAAGLLSDNATGIDSEMKSFIDKAKTASGIEQMSIFGASRYLDFSQFLPRGHYAGSPILEHYFRAMMWLGRIELRLVDVDESGNRKLMRREVEDILALGELFATDTQAQWTNIDQIVGLFVGEADYMMLPQIQPLRDALGITASTQLSSLGDQKVFEAIDSGNFGVQRVSSQLMVVDDGVTALPNSFAFLGQRYTVDGHVMSKVVYPNTDKRRMMPNPLDVAFAAFGNDQALPLLKNELDTYGYAPSLSKARQLVEWHGPDYWESSLYTLWTDSLRQLSTGQYDVTGLPAVARTDAWGRRLLNSQLGSWAELRHDTLLYAKQSYTGIPLCEYPDGYVDPYPNFFAKLKQLGTVAATKLAGVLPSSSSAQVVSYFQTLSSVSDRLATLATEELTGAPRTQEDLDFFNDAVVVKAVNVVCATVDQASGWYAKLFYDVADALKADPTIADVHTQPADESGNIVGRVLHVGTGNPRLMVVSVDSCDGPRAYAGVVSSYFEQTTDNFKRLTDQDWSTALQSATPADVSWMQDLVVR